MERMSKTIEISVYDLQELRNENKNLKEKLSEITMVADDEKQSIEHILELEEENKKLKSDLAYERTMLDNVRAEYESLQNVIKKLKARIEIQKLNIQFFEKELDLYQKLHEKTLSAEGEQDLYED